MKKVSIFKILGFVAMCIIVMGKFFLKFVVFLLSMVSETNSERARYWKYDE